MASLMNIYETVTKNVQHHSQFLLVLNYQEETKKQMKLFQSSLDYLIKKITDNNNRETFNEVHNTTNKQSIQCEAFATTNDTKNDMVAKMKT